MPVYSSDLENGMLVYNTHSKNIGKVSGLEHWEIVASIPVLAKIRRGRREGKLAKRIWSSYNLLLCPQSQEDLNPGMKVKRIDGDNRRRNNVGIVVGDSEGRLSMAAPDLVKVKKTVRYGKGARKTQEYYFWRLGSIVILPEQERDYFFWRLS